MWSGAGELYCGERLKELEWSDWRRGGSNLLDYDLLDHHDNGAVHGALWW